MCLTLSVHYHLASLRSLLHPCPIDSVHLVHNGLNSTGEFQYPGNKVSIWFFRSCTSCSGRSGSSRSSATVHLSTTDSPKNDTLLSQRSSAAWFSLLIGDNGCRSCDDWVCAGSSDECGSTNGCWAVSGCVRSSRTPALLMHVRDQLKETVVVATVMIQ